MKSKTFLLQTQNGKQQVYTTGRFQFSLTEGIQLLPSGYNGDFSIPVKFLAATSTAKDRASFLKKVNTQIGDKLVWVKGEMVDYIAW